MLRQTFTIFILLISTTLFAQKEEIVFLTEDSAKIEGTLHIPEAKGKIPVALIIAGSGPTDRDGNNPMMTNNSLKLIATSLDENGIASLRYDKRGVGASKAAMTSESDLRFDHYVNDAVRWVEFLRKDGRFGDITVIGHSEGSLIGMIAAQEGHVDKFVSLAGAGEPAADLLRTQLSVQPDVLRMSEPILHMLETGETTENVSPYLFTLFRPSVQPYMISWFKYDPRKEIAKLTQPVLILQGTTDIQVSVEHADKLSKANPAAQLSIIQGMNHILKEAEAEKSKNIETYNMPELPLQKGLMEAIVDFIKK